MKLPFVVKPKESRDVIRDDVLDMLREQKKSFLSYDARSSPNNAPFVDATKYAIYEDLVHTLYPYPRAEIPEIVDNNTAIRLPIDVLCREVILFGVKISKRWEYKCANKNCGYEYDDMPVPKEEIPLYNHDIEVDDEQEPNLKIKDNRKPPPKAEKYKEPPKKCEFCGGTEFLEPDSMQYKETLELTKMEWNDTGQKIHDILYELERMSDVFDDGYMYLHTLYNFDKDGLITSYTQDDMMAIDPGLSFKIRDHMDRPGRTIHNQYVYVCTDHRDRMVKVNPKDDGSDDPPDIVRCPVHGCNKECIPAALYMTRSGLHTETEYRQIFGKDEVILSHGKYRKSRNDGYPICYTAHNLLKLFNGSERYTATFFDNDRPPKGMLFIGTRNPEELNKQMTRARQISAKDPNYMPVVSAPMGPDSKSIGSMVEYVNLTGSLEDLQLSQQLQMARVLIAALYGVMPIYEGGEGQTVASDALSMTISNRATYRNQRWLETTFLDEILRRRGITDWKIQLTAVEITDDIRSVQLKTQKAVYAQHMAALGYKHHLDGDGEFVFSSIPEEPQTPAAMPAAPKDTPENPSYAPKDDTNAMTGEREKKNPSDIGGAMTGQPGAGDGTSYDKK